MQKIADKLGWKAEWRLYKWRDPDGKIAELLQRGAKISSIIDQFGIEALIGVEFWKSNVALNEGLAELIDIICGIGTPTKWDETNARLGVGNDNTAPQATQTGLIGSSKAYKAMDTNYPARSNQTAEWRATFGSAEANFAWEEYTVVNASDDTGENLNRCIASKGTKASGESWTLALQITFS